MRGTSSVSSPTTTNPSLINKKQHQHHFSFTTTTLSPQPKKLTSLFSRTTRPLVIRATKNEENETTEAQELQKREQQQQQQSLNLEDLEMVNPVGLGGKSRQMFDQAWKKFLCLGQISRTTRADDNDALDALLIREGPMCEFTSPGAQSTTVLVVGATSSTGRIVVQKLMLRGYSVKALVRKVDEEVVDMLPRSVDIMVRDVGDPETLKAATR